MLPYKTILKLNLSSRVPKYLQITNEFIKNISGGIIAPGQKLPGSRQLSEILGVNRRTVISAFDELVAQGWITVSPNKGCFVKTKLPESKPRSFAKELTKKETERVSFHLQKSRTYEVSSDAYDIKINDGYPDVRLAPLKELAKNYSYIMGSSMANHLMTYRQAFLGDEILRQELVKYLAETRSIHVDIDNVMTTRGSLMAFYILFKTILSPSHNEVVVGYPGFNEGYETIRSAGGKLNFVNVDAEGMRIDEIASLCKQKTIRAVFIIPHHHYPTTVYLSASRRMQLLSLAEQYGFAIIEDDYDYDFHYSSAPILPLASTDYQGSVAYVGSFSKTIAPSMRLGFIVAPKELIQASVEVSRFIDSFGNIVLERAVAMLFKEGLIRRHLRKALKTYRERRDHFCEILKTEFADEIAFNTPEGGMAIWANLRRHKLEEVIKIGKKNRLKIPNTSGFYSSSAESNNIRMGFASMNEAEVNELMHKLKKTLKT